MQILDNTLAIIYRALSISLNLIGPVSLLLYLALMCLIYLAYYKRGLRLGSFVHIMGCIFFFFIVWNHPGYRWYKMRPWNGGYVYTLVMIVVYVYLPMKLVMFGTELWRNLTPKGKSDKPR
ncbi:hypothetical protein [Desulfovibrio ferrophilus]|uniref:Cytochrome c assembly protein n=1 Tax=Desulfovibrio ferrophilus TaxID=241368 RepID=A0A2Z6B012_9BACT|nr:hypothetical protein [Desulfovibrio ferrophilus]BBD08775.1 cytochrome c assembly protein [Desulfovibrio ferrophilus]